MTLYTVLNTKYVLTQYANMNKEIHIVYQSEGLIITEY